MSAFPSSSATQGSDGKMNTAKTRKHEVSVASGPLHSSLPIQMPGLTFPPSHTHDLMSLTCLVYSALHTTAVVLLPVLRGQGV